MGKKVIKILRNKFPYLDLCKRGGTWAATLLMLHYTNSPTKTVWGQHFSCDELSNGRITFERES